MWALLLVPTYLMAEGWQYLLEPHGVLYQFGLYSAWADHTFFSPVGVVFVDSLATAPFAYLTMSAALGGLGSQFEEAVRVHGGGRVATARVVVPVLAPAVLASIALVFVETMSDFGVASTLAFQSHFTMATYGIYEAIDNNPAQFGVAGVLSILLLASAALPLALQSRVTRGRSYAILSGRTRAATRCPVAPTGQMGAHLRRRPVLLPGPGRSRPGRLHGLVRAGPGPAGRRPLPDAWAPTGRSSRARSPTGTRSPRAPPACPAPCCCPPSWPPSRPP